MQKNPLHFTTQEPANEQSSDLSKNSTAIHSHSVAVQHNFQRFALPFPTQIERSLFRHPALIITTSAFALITIRGLDLLYCLVALILAASAALFKQWMRNIPEVLAKTYERCRDETQRATYTQIMESQYSQITGQARLIYTGTGIAISIAFIAFTTGNGSSPRTIFAWCLGLVPWGWMIGAAGAVTIGMAQLVRRVGAAGLFHVSPEHSDGCGGLKYIGTFYIHMVSPLLLATALLGLAAIDPKITLKQSNILNTYHWPYPSEHASPTVKSSLHSSSPRAVKTICVRAANQSGQEQFRCLPEDVETQALQLKLRSEVSAARVDLQKKECADLSLSIHHDAYKSCIFSLVSESMHLEEVRKRGHRRIWNQRIIPFARVGLLILTVAIGLSITWSLGGIHAAMRDVRDKHSTEMAELLDKTEEELKKRLRSAETKEAADHSDHLEKLRREAARIRNYPVWPFDAAGVSKIVIPQALTLGSTLTGLVSNWLAN